MLAGETVVASEASEPLPSTSAATPKVDTPRSAATPSRTPAAGSPSAREDGFRRAASPLCGRRLPVFRDLATFSAERREESAGDERIAGAARTSSSAGVSGDFSAEPFPFAFVAERRASASAAASAVRRAPPPCASGPYDIGASVLFGNV